MEKVAHVFRSFADSGRSDRDYYQSLTPEQRLSILLELIQQNQPHETEQRLERVYRVVKLKEG